jgi:hypothetical protein
MIDRGAVCCCILSTVRLAWEKTVPTSQTVASREAKMFRVRVLIRAVETEAGFFHAKKWITPLQSALRKAQARPSMLPYLIVPPMLPLHKIKSTNQALTADM